MKKRVLIFGFSNVATSLGFSTNVIEKMKLSCPDIEVVRVGLGALQPHAAIPFLRMTFERLGSFSHVLLDIHGSAFALHPLSTEELARELLFDLLHTIDELGAQPLFALLYRDWLGKKILDFNTITRALCDDFEIPLLDLSEALIAEKGEEFIHTLLRDVAHVNEIGAEFQGARVYDFLLETLNSDAQTDLSMLPKPQWRRSAIDLSALTTGLPKSDIEVSGLPLTYTTFSATDDCTIEFGEPLRAMALSFLYHTAGGHTDVQINDDPKLLRMTTIDPFSYFTRIGVLAFDFFRGTDIRRLHIGPPTDATDVALIKREKTRPLHNQIGTLLVMRPA